MSSEQITAERPRPHGEPPCPSCGAGKQRPGDTHCWLCGAPLTEEGASLANIKLPNRGSDNPAFILFGVLSILMGIALALEGPGVLFIILIVALPALIRTVMMSRSDSGATLAALGAFLSSTGTMLVVGLAAFVAFFTTCFVVCMGGLAVNDLSQGRNYDWIWVAGIGAGIIPALLVAALLCRRFWPGKA